MPIAIGILVIWALPYLLPLLAFACWIYFEVRARRPKPNPRLDADETRKLFKAEARLGAVRARLSQVANEGAHLSVNKDGSYHRGNKLGKKLNDERVQLKEELSKLASRTYVLRNKPRDMLNEWMHELALCASFRFATAAYLFVLLIGYFSKKSFDVLSFGTAAAVTGAIIVGFIVCYKIRRIRLEKNEKDTRRYVEQFSEGRFSEESNSAHFHDGAGGSAHGEPNSDRRSSAKDEASGCGPWYVALGVGEDASESEINSAWRQAMRKNHPDRVAELDREFQVLAAERTTTLNAAREEGLRHCRSSE
jgi:hypothetical protein